MRPALRVQSPEGEDSKDSKGRGLSWGTPCPGGLAGHTVTGLPGTSSTSHTDWGLSPSLLLIRPLLRGQGDGLPRGTDPAPATLLELLPLRGSQAQLHPQDRSTRWGSALTCTSPCSPVQPASLLGHLWAPTPAFYPDANKQVLEELPNCPCVCRVWSFPLLQRTLPTASVWPYGGQH